MNLISGNSVSETVLYAYNKIIFHGEHQDSRNGGATPIFDTTLEVSNPRSRHLHLEGRTSNIFALIAETFWVMAGDDRVDPYLSFFIPRAPQYSDDGTTWHAAYGPRIYRFNQHLDALRAFKEDGVNTRRSYIQISMPDLDSMDAIETRYGVGHKPKDLSCNREIHFYVQHGKFCAKTIQRSGDIIFGTGSINPFEFSFLQELMYNEIKLIYPEIKLGAYRWHVTNAHLYDFTKVQASTAIDSSENYVTSGTEQNNWPVIATDINYWHDFFSDLVTVYTEAITCSDNVVTEVCDTLIGQLAYKFMIYDVPTDNNLLWTYVQLVAHYISSKRGVALPEIVDLTSHQNEFVRSIELSTFRKFEVMV